MTKRTLIIAALFVIRTGLIVWVAFQLPSREPQVLVTFLAYTNAASGTQLATFAVSNFNSFVVRRQSGYWIERKTSTGVTNQASSWFSSSNDLNARASEIVAVPVPTNPPPWRVLLSIRTDLGPIAEMMEHVNFMIFGFGETLPHRESYQVRSDWIED